jgi:hypothetical protein
MECTGSYRYSRDDGSSDKVSDYPADDGLEHRIAPVGTEKPSVEQPADRPPGAAGRGPCAIIGHFGVTRGRLFRHAAMVERLPAFTLDDRGYVLSGPPVEVQVHEAVVCRGAGVPVGVARPAAQGREFRYQAGRFRPPRKRRHQGVMRARDRSRA